MNTTLKRRIERIERTVGVRDRRDDGDYLLWAMAFGYGHDPKQWTDEQRAELYTLPPFTLRDWLHTPSPTAKERAQEPEYDEGDSEERRAKWKADVLAKYRQEPDPKRPGGQGAHSAL